MKFVKNRYSFWAVMVVVIVLLSLVIVYMQGDSNLSSYEGNEITSATTESTTEKVDLTTYLNDEKMYSIGIPPEWTKVIKDGFDTYIHSPSATSVQVQVVDYTPYVLTTTTESVNKELSSNGCELLEFSWYDTTSYLTVYEKSGSNGLKTTYVEATYLDRKTIIRLVFVVNSQYLSQMQSTVSAIINSFKWDKQDPFPMGVGLHYSEYGNFEFGYPIDWKFGSSNNAYIAQDEATGAVMSITATESAVSYKNLTKVNYTQYASVSRSGFVLQNYSASDNIIYAQSTYMANNTKMILVQYLIASGSYEYTITFETPQDSFSEQAELFQNAINSFRYF